MFLSIKLSYFKKTNIFSRLSAMGYKWIIYFRQPEQYPTQKQGILPLNRS